MFVLQYDLALKERQDLEVHLSATFYNANLEQNANLTSVPPDGAIQGRRFPEAPKIQGRLFSDHLSRALLPSLQSSQSSWQRCRWSLQLFRYPLQSRLRPFRSCSRSS